MVLKDYKHNGQSCPTFITVLYLMTLTRIENKKIVHTPENIKIRPYTVSMTFLSEMVLYFI